MILTVLALHRLVAADSPTSFDNLSSQALKKLLKLTTTLKIDIITQKKADKACLKMRHMDKVTTDKWQTNL